MWDNKIIWYPHRNCVLSADLSSEMTSIGSFSFENCDYLTGVGFPASLTHIGESAFCGCDSLSWVMFNDVVAQIDLNAFYGCNALTDVYYFGTASQWNAISIADGNTALTNARKHFACTVTFNANGGTGDMARKKAFSDLSFTLSNNSFTRDGYTFKAWNTKADGSGTTYADGAEMTLTSDLTLYAQWNSSTTTAAVTLPTPTRSGYSFQGWATSSSASNGVTGSYTPTGNVTLYAIWKEEGTTSGTLSLGSVRGAPGSEVTLELTLDKNPGIMMLSFRLSYDKNKLQYLGGEDGSLTGWSFSTTGDGVLWDGDNDSTATGTIVKLHFKILESAVEGETSITLNALEAWNYNEEGISFGTSAGKVTISKRIPGDTTGDGKVNGLDLIRLRKYLAGDNVVLN